MFKNKLENPILIWYTLTKGGFKMIKVIESQRLTPTETQWKIELNGKEIWFSKWVDDDFLTDYEIFNGEELLNEDEYEEVISFIDEQRI